MDYPFTSWSAYYAALTDSLCTEYYGSDYPLYQEQHDENEHVDYEIVERLLADGLDPQEGLDGFMQAVLDGSRYADEFDDLGAIVSLFTAAGATPKMDMLFEPLYADEPEYFEDEMQQYTSRGLLIDSFSELDVKKYCDWSSIKATYWEKIDDDLIKKDYRKACFMYLKYVSNYLKRL